MHGEGVERDHLGRTPFASFTVRLFTPSFLIESSLELLPFKSVLKIFVLCGFLFFTHNYVSECHEEGFHLNFCAAYVSYQILQISVTYHAIKEWERITPLCQKKRFYRHLKNPSYNLAISTVFGKRKQFNGN